jgi:hypothetical protein
MKCSSQVFGMTSPLDWTAGEGTAGCGGEWGGQSVTTVAIEIRAATGNKSKVKNVVIAREGKYAEMDYYLAKRIHDTRDAGIKYPLWMVRTEAV